MITIARRNVIVAKKIRCLKCGHEFVTHNLCNHTCGSCAAQNTRVSKMMQETPVPYREGQGHGQ